MNPFKKWFSKTEQTTTVSDQTKPRLNVIMILVDGVRLERAQRFQNFQKFFQQGTLFTNMFTYAPYTIASVYSIFTGTYGSKNGVDNYYGSLNYKKDQFKTLAEYFKEAGYFTYGESLNEVCVPGYGFDKFIIQTEEYQCKIEHPKILREVKAISQRDKNFFLFLHYRHVHDSLVKNVIKKYDDYSEEYFKQKEQNLANYDSYIQEADDYLGIIDQELEQLSLKENSLIVLFSDHGASVGEKVGERVYGSYCYDYTLHMLALLIQAKLFPGQEIKALTRGIDLLPTILSVFGITPNSKQPIKGRSLMPIIDGKETISRSAFSETAGLGGPHPSPKKPNVQSIRTNEWKLVHHLTPNTKELYHLTADPQETNNLIGTGRAEEKILADLLKKERD